MEQKPIPAGVLGDDLGQQRVSEAGRSFLQARLALFARLGGMLVAAHFLLVNVLRSAEGKPFSDWFSAVGQAELGTAVGLSMLWLVLRATRLEVPQLRVADSIGTLGVVLGLALVGYLARSSWAPEMIVMVGGFFALSTRATLVPSSTLHTLRLGLAAAVIQTAALYLIAAQAAGASHPPWYYAAIGSCWSALIVAATTIAARVVYGLRREVSRAQRLGQYLLEEQIGEGAMGVVYRARHAILARPTAVKLLRKEVLGDRAEQRFRREIFATARLANPSTVAIYDCGRTPSGALYYAMELLDGVELDEVIKHGGPLPPGRVIELLRQACSSLAEAHDHGLIHRDVKPGNLMICRHGGRYDVLKVLDFGLVRQTAEQLADASGQRAPELTGETNLVGTPLFMAPEAITAPLDVDGRTDLYALGATAYFMLTGTLMFEAKTRSDAFHQNLTTNPARPSDRLGATIPQDLEELVMACLAKAPEERPSSARELEERLAACQHAGAWTQAEARCWWDESPWAEPMRQAPPTPLGVLPIERESSDDADEPQRVTGPR